MGLRPIARFVAVWAVMGALAGCGGGGGGGDSSSNTPGGGIGVTPMWPQPDGGTGTALPDAIKTLRVVFQSNSGFACCLAVDPTMVPINEATGQRSLVLDQLPPGPGTFLLSGFATDFVPAPDGITAICATTPPGVGAPCDQTRPATPAFESDPISTNIVPGSLVHGGEVEVHSLPFVFAFDPAISGTNPSPVSLHFTAGDAQAGIAGNSIVAEVLFRSLSKRSALTLKPCDDSTDAPCSENGTLKVKGFQAVGAPLFLPAGAAEVHITAQNLTDPPRDVDFRYEFTVFPGQPEETGLVRSSAASNQGPSSEGSTPRGPGGPVAPPAAGTPTAVPPATATPTPTATPTRIREPEL